MRNCCDNLFENGCALRALGPAGESSARGCVRFPGRNDSALDTLFAKQWWEPQWTGAI